VRAQPQPLERKPRDRRPEPNGLIREVHLERRKEYQARKTVRHLEPRELARECIAAQPPLVLSRGFLPFSLLPSGIGVGSTSGLRDGCRGREEYGEPEGEAAHESERVSAAARRLANELSQAANSRCAMLMKFV
jgi:hypothetical protein